MKANFSLSFSCKSILKKQSFKLITIRGHPLGNREDKWQLVQGHLDAHHIEESISPWKSPIFVVKKKSGKWRMVTDLRAVNKAIQPMDPLQSGISLPSLLPKE